MAGEIDEINSWNLITQFFSSTDSLSKAFVQLNFIWLYREPPNQKFFITMLFN